MPNYKYPIDFIEQAKMNGLVAETEYEFTNLLIAFLKEKGFETWVKEKGCEKVLLDKEELKEMKKICDFRAYNEASLSQKRFDDLKEIMCFDCEHKNISCDIDRLN